MASAHETTVRQVYEAAHRRDMDAILAGTHEAVEVRPVLGANLGANVYRGHELRGERGRGRGARARGHLD
jgi:ketosteroid isomerase-like protein